MWKLRDDSSTPLINGYHMLAWMIQMCMTDFKSFIFGMPVEAAAPPC